MSFYRELKVVMIAALGLLAYLILASAVMIAMYLNLGMTAFLVVWLVVLLIPINFALCSLFCIIAYRYKEKKYQEIKEHLTELSELTMEQEEPSELERKRERKTLKVSSESV